MIFVYKITTGILITELSPKACVREYRHAELLIQLRTIQDARAWVATQYPATPCLDMVKETYTGITPEGREMMRDKKRGLKNPNALGLSPSHKKKIAQTMKKRRGEFHHMWNKQHRAKSKLQIALSMKRLPKRRWCLDVEGNEHFIPADSPLPDGWVWGRKLGTLRY